MSGKSLKASLEYSVYKILVFYNLNLINIILIKTNSN